MNVAQLKTGTFVFSAPEGLKLTLKRPAEKSHERASILPSNAP
jgi:hypothetical protein